MCTNARVYTRPPKTTSQGEKKKDDDDDGAINSEEEKKNMKGFTIRGVDVAKGRGRGGQGTGETKGGGKRRRKVDVPFSGFFAVIDPTRLNEQLRQFQDKIPKQFVDKDTGKFKLPDFKAALEELREERQHMEHHPDRKRLSSVADFFKYTEEEGMFIIVTRCSIPFLFLSTSLSFFLSLFCDAIEQHVRKQNKILTEVFYSKQ